MAGRSEFRVDEKNILYGKPVQEAEALLDNREGSADHETK